MNIPPPPQPETGMPIAVYFEAIHAWIEQVYKELKKQESK